MLLFTCRLDIPAAVMTPNMIMNMPPSTGVGMVVKIAPILPNIPIKSMKIPLRRITIRLPTCQTNKWFEMCFADLLVLLFHTKDSQVMKSLVTILPW